MSSNPRASDRKARPKSLRGRNSVLHSYVETESDRCQQAAYRLLNERQGNRKGRDWGSRCMKIWKYFDNPSFRIQLFIGTLNKDIQRVRPRTASSAHSGRCHRTSCSLREHPISREEPTEAAERRPSIGMSEGLHQLRATNLPINGKGSMENFTLILLKPIPLLVHRCKSTAGKPTAPVQSE